ncbi:tumor necrosis factor receptor superfamily member 14-like isoform X2 [Parambassis ranga]|uniref:Tumor necrosis factor receptor superfamily member 14-like isoform X2 n=1 Tax=Parambassis ranga TaxID=210632 RepID=A0A6P7IUC3_9TELE|nr:tumor necrosis factor receptor superfamily member 14-like isoform X2 [Parambassis ranga]
MFSASIVFGFVAVFSVPGLCCRATEYSTSDGQCCPMCNEGTFVRRDCTQFSGTGCAPCSGDTFMNQLNGLNRCFSCTLCDSGHGLFVKRQCTTISDTVCEALSGYFCKSWSDVTGCSLAQKLSHCAPGQRIKEPGSSRSDTLCEDCRAGYFSADGTDCTAWTATGSQGGWSLSQLLGGTPVHHRATHRPFTLTSTPTRNLERPINPTSRSLECGKKPDLCKHETAF